MKSPLNQSAVKFLCLIVIALGFILACNKDSDEPYVISNTESITDENGLVKVTSKAAVAKTISLAPIQDAYLQSGQGYNQQIVRVEEGRRMSYLMFDLRDIKSEGGSISSVDLEFSVSSDGGNGSITVSTGDSTSWSEENLSSSNAPEAQSLLAKVTDDYAIGQTKTIRLDKTKLSLGIVSIVISQDEGNDFAFASKEHPDEDAPKLKVSYTVTSETDASSSQDETSTSESQSDDDKPIAAVISGVIPSSDEVPLTIEFKAWNSKNQKDITGYFWDFKDGSTTTKKNPSHTFTKAGNYNVALQVKNADGFTDTATREIIVGGGTSGSSEDNDESSSSNDSDINVAAVISAATPSNMDAPASIDFKAWNSVNQKDIKGYFWDFKDGSTTTTKNPTHTFTETGTYAVVLTVKNAEGQTHSATKNFSITGESSSSDADSGGSGGSEGSSGNSDLNIAAVISGSIPSTTPAPATIEFKAYNSKNQNQITGYFWDFGDGNTTSRKNPTHVYSEPGTYTVKLIVKNAANQTHSTTRKLTVTSSSNDSGGSGGSSGGSDNGSSGGSSGGSDNGGSTSGSYPSNAVFASSFGFKSGDATSAFEAAIKSGSSYVVIDKQSSDWVIRPTRFFDLRDMTIVFESGVTLRAKSGAFGENDELLHLTRAKNVNIEGSGATFRMNKSEYSSGEQRHALRIDRCSGLKVKGLTVRDSGGDGIIITGDSRGAYSENITLENMRSLNNKRDGITIVSAQNVYIRNSEFSNSSGKKPEAGATLEPDHPNERIVNINFSNCKFLSNDSSGLHLSMVRMNRSSRAISVKVTDCEFNGNSKSPESGVARTAIYLSQGPHNDPVGGEVRFERIRFTGNTHQIIFSRKAHDSFRAVFKDCSAQNVSTSGSRGVIELQASDTETTLGGFVFDNFRMQYNRDVPFMEINAPSSNFVVRDVTGDFNITEPNDNPIKYSGGYRSSKNQNVSIDYDH